jgi:DNA-binding NarL/FixJ family response regulator
MLVDDHTVVRQGLQSMLAGVSDVVIVGEASSANEALEKIPVFQPDVVLSDIRMPGMNGLRLLYQIHERFPKTKVIILTHYDDDQFLLEAFRAGAYGYLLKNVGRDELLDVVRTVHNGKRMLSQELIDSVLKQFADLGMNQAMQQFGLSKREIDLLRAVADGLTNREIADRLHWSETTVKRKLSDVFQKLDVSDRAQAVAVAMRHGLL